MGRGSKAVAVLGKGEVGVGDNDPTSSIVLGHDVAEVFRFFILPDSECAKS